MLEVLANLLMPGFEWVYVLMLLTTFLKLKNLPTRQLFNGALAGVGTAMVLFYLNKKVVRLEMLDVIEKGLVVFSLLGLFIWLWLIVKNKGGRLSTFILSLLGFTLSLDKGMKLVSASYSALAWQNGFNSDWVFRAGAILSTFILLLIMAAGMRSIGRKLKLPMVIVFLVLGYVELFVFQLVEWLQMLFGLQILPLTMWVLDVLVPFVNNKAVFSYVLMIMAIFFLGFLFVQMQQYEKEPVNPAFNPAQCRKVHAEKQQIRRWLFSFATVLLLIFSSVFGERVMANKEVKEKPAIPVTAEAGHIYLDKGSLLEKELNIYSFQVDDKTKVRFLAVRKAGENVGVALDACEICGVAGYYEDDGHIICKKCNSAISVNTIGFPGGCNPIPLKFENKDDGTISIAVSQLEKVKGIFE